MPSKQTLKKYGLSQQEFDEILERQGNVCPICEKVPTTGRWIIDHDHKPNWKKKKPEERNKAVRGILCWFCNKYYLGRSITIKKSENVTRYLKSYVIRQK